MKKLLLLGAAMIAALALNAQTYDFTKGSLTFNAGSSINFLNGTATADDITWTKVSPGLNTEAGEGAKSFSKAGGFFTFDEISGLEFVALNSDANKDAIRFAAVANGGIVGNGGDDFIKIPNQTAGTVISVTYTMKGTTTTNLTNGNKAKDKGAGDANYNLTAATTNTEPAAKGTMVTNKYTVAADGDAYLYITNARVEKIVIGGGDASGVDEAVAEGATLEYYSVAGVKLGAPVKGERIVRAAVKDGKKVASDIVIYNE